MKVQISLICSVLLFASCKQRQTADAGSAGSVAGESTDDATAQTDVQSIDPSKLEGIAIVNDPSLGLVNASGWQSTLASSLSGLFVKRSKPSTDAINPSDLPKESQFQEPPQIEVVSPTQVKIGTTEVPVQQVAQANPKMLPTAAGNTMVYPINGSVGGKQAAYTQNTNAWWDKVLKGAFGDTPYKTSGPNRIYGEGSDSYLVVSNASNLTITKAQPLTGAVVDSTKYAQMGYPSSDNDLLGAMINQGIVPKSSTMIGSATSVTDTGGTQVGFKMTYTYTVTRTKLDGTTTSYPATSTVYFSKSRTGLYTSGGNYYQQIVVNKLQINVNAQGKAIP